MGGAVQLDTQTRTREGRLPREDYEKLLKRIE